MHLSKFNCLLSGVLSAVLLLSSCGDDDNDVVTPLIPQGANVTVNNTFQASAFNINDETDFAVISGMQAGAFAADATVSGAVEFSAYIGLYDIDISETSISFDIIAEADDPNFGDLFRVLEAGTYDRYYFTFDEAHNVSGFSSSNPSVNLRIDAENVLVVEIGEGYDFNPEQAFTITLQDDNTTAITPQLELPSNLTVTDQTFFPEDIVVENNVAYVSGLGDGSIRMFDLTTANPTAMTFAEAEVGYGQAWGLKSDGTVLLSLLNNADFGGGMSGPAKLVAYNLASGVKIGEWDLPSGAIGHTVSIVDGKYYVGDFGQPRIFEIDPASNTVNDNWFSSTQWDPAISGMGGIIYNGTDGFYASQGNKLWYLPISGGQPGTLQEVSVSGLETIDADGISWNGVSNTLYYTTNDTGDPANVGTVYSVVFSDAINAVGTEIANGLDDTSGLWYFTSNAKRYLFVIESQFGALFGLNDYEAPFNINIINL